MQTKQKLTLKQVAIILCLSGISISRLSKSDKTFPELERVGRSVFIDASKLYKFLSGKAGKTVTSDDNLLLTKHLQEYYSKSHTWIWQQVKAGNLPKPFKINRTNYWLEREIVDEVEEAA